MSFLENYLKTWFIILRIKMIKFLVVSISMGMLLVPSISFGTGYYVDSRFGIDTNPGNSRSLPWNTIGRVQRHTFKPGDTIYFRRNSIWTGELKINNSGSPGNPIVYTSYDKGSYPIIKNPGVDRGSSITINADHIIAEHFLLKESHEAGIMIMPEAEYNIVRNNEVTLAGSGISVKGKHNLITGNYTHNLTMIVNDEGGDNDFGAVGVWLFGSNNEVSYNRMFNCIAPSLDYGHDGGVVEFYGDVDSCYIHHNWGENCDGAFEVGGREDTVTDNLIAYNVFVNNGLAGGFHVGGKFGVYMERMRVENNLFIEENERDYAIGFWGGVPEDQAFQCRNNIFYIPKIKRISNLSEFEHEHNLYFMGESKNIGISLGKSEHIADPLFSNIDEDNYHLQPGSPAIDAGLDLSHQMDYDGNPVPAGLSPDIGPFEFVK